MYVCLCKAITDTHLREAVYAGATSLRDVRQQLGIMTQCGKCGVITKQIVEETLQQFNSSCSDNLFYAAS